MLQASVMAGCGLPERQAFQRAVHNPVAAAPNACCQPCLARSELGAQPDLKSRARAGH